MTNSARLATKLKKENLPQSLAKKLIKNLVKDLVRGAVKREIQRAIKENILEGFTPNEEFLKKCTDSIIRWEMRVAECREWRDYEFAEKLEDSVINLTPNLDTAIEEENRRVLKILNTPNTPNK